MTALPLLLALHSCSDCFGMALLDPQQAGAEPLVQVHPDGRGLSNRGCGVDRQNLSPGHLCPGSMAALQQLQQLRHIRLHIKLHLNSGLG